MRQPCLYSAELIHEPSIVRKVTAAVPHKVFIVFLLMTIVTAAIAVGVRGFSYYTTPLQLRPFRGDYETMKPSGRYSQGLGVIGATMIVIGVTLYSTRKRVRALWSLGTLSRWQEFHIFLCLLGPVLVVYHTTFKASGIAGITLWTMLSVAASGVVGRVLYVQIPRNRKGAELTAAQISEELERLGSKLASSPVGVQLVRRMDQSFASLRKPANLPQMVQTFGKLYSIRGKVKRSVHAIISSNPQSQQSARQLYHAAVARATLIQKSIVLAEAEKLFYYWHVVHVPFTVIMFITLAAHVTVNVLLGYTWIF